MRNVMLLVIVLGLFGVSCGDNSGPSSGPCGDFNERLCSKGAQCQGSSGEFTVSVGFSGSGTYTSASQCENWALLSESTCNEASESEQEACDSEIASAQCDSNSIYVGDACEF
jgi:hypothetical protein